MYILKNINYFVRAGKSNNQCIKQIRKLNLLPKIYSDHKSAAKTRETLSESVRSTRIFFENLKNLRLKAILEMPRAKVATKAAKKAVAAPQQNETVKSKDDHGAADEMVSSKTNGNIDVESKNATNLMVTAKVTKGRGKGKKVTEAVVEVHSPEAVAEAVITGRGGRKKAIVATIENGDVGEPSAKVLMQIKVPKAKGRGKRDASTNADDNVAAATVQSRGRGRDKKTADVTEDVSIQNSENAENETVAGDDIAAVSMKMKTAAKGRKRKEQPTISDAIESEKISIGDKEESAVPPKKRATATSATTTMTAVKIKSEPLSDTQVDLLKVQDPVTVVDGRRAKTPKPEKPKKEKATAKKSKSNKEVEEISEANDTEANVAGQEITEKKTRKEKTTQKNVSAVKPTSRGRKRALSASKGTTDLSINAAAINSNDIKTEIIDAGEGETSPKKKRGGGSGKTAKAPKATKAAVKQLPVELDEQSTEIKGEKKPESSRGRKRQAAANVVATNEVDAVDGTKPSKSKKVINDTETTYNKADFDLPAADNSSNTETNSLDKRYNLKISSWNVAGLRSWCKKDGLKFLEYEEPDIFCMQEIKCTTDQLPEEAARIPGYHPYWLCMPGGYAGVAIYSKKMPINVEYGLGNAEFDEVGRIITAEYEKFFLVCVYVPNSGRKLVNLEARMRWEKLFQEFIKKLDARKPVVICGDMNVSHNEIDLANPKTNTRNAGFTQEEREKMSELLALGYVDTFRHLYPTRTGAYTFWTYMGNARARNVGWRLDYFLVSQRFTKRVVESCIRAQCKGSDHCPITLFLKL